MSLLLPGPMKTKTEKSVLHRLKLVLHEYSKTGFNHKEQKSISMQPLSLIQGY